MILKATVKHIDYEGVKAKRIILESESGRRIDTLLVNGSEAEIKKLIVKVNEPLPPLPAPELPYEARDTLELDDKTGKITVVKPAPPETEAEPDPEVITP